MIERKVEVYHCEDPDGNPYSYGRIFYKDGSTLIVSTENAFAHAEMVGIQVIEYHRDKP